ncbi:MAG: hypothetical protein WCK17_10185 [Verrucomicrobiota bacterium]
MQERGLPARQLSGHFHDGTLAVHPVCYQIRKIAAKIKTLQKILAIAVWRSTFEADEIHCAINRLSQIGLWSHSSFQNFSFTPNPPFPASGPSTSSFNGLHPKSNFLAMTNSFRVLRRASRFNFFLTPVADKWARRAATPYQRCLCEIHGWKTLPIRIDAHRARRQSAISPTLLGGLIFLYAQPPQ